MTTIETYWSDSPPSPLLIQFSDTFEVSSRKLRLFACACIRNALSAIKTFKHASLVTEILHAAEQFAEIERESESPYDLRHTELRRLHLAMDSALNAEEDGRIDDRTLPSSIDLLIEAEELLRPAWRAANICNVDVTTTTEEFRLNVLRDIMGEPDTTYTRLQCRPKNAKCNRTACDHRAICKHTQNEKFYCVSCARKINEANFQGLVEFPQHAQQAMEANGRAAEHIVRHCYETHDFSDLPVAADALEDANYTDATILDHLRGPGPHYRGCWAVDHLLRKR